MNKDDNDNTPKQDGSHLSRRRFVAELTATTALAGATRVFSQPADALPPGSESGIEHIVLVMMENRSFDHFLGWVPGADGRQAGLSYVDRNGQSQSTYPLAPEFQGCAHPDPDHSYDGGRAEYNGGACDGWLRAGDNDAFAIGYYTANDLSFYGPALPQWTTGDRYFASILSQTFPNRIYQHSAQTDRLDNSVELVRLPTIWDRLADKGLSGRYYYSDAPMLALWGRKYLPISFKFPQFIDDCATNNLPAVSFIDPGFIGEIEGLSNDDHPHADIRNGQAFLNSIYTAVTTSPAWPKTVLIINYDEWGGFFDHVPPPAAPVPRADRIAGSDGRLGFRVPNMIVAPWARRGYVSNTTFDHTSVLKMIEWRWSLNPLTVRDFTANNLADVLDFSHLSLAAPQFSVPPGPFGGECGTGFVPANAPDWLALKAVAQRHDWPV